MSVLLRSGLRAVAVGGGALLLAGCAENIVHMSPDFGRALREQQAAHVADPDAAYRGEPDPASDGARTRLAQDRYQKGETIPPTSMATSSVKSRTQTGAGGE